MMSRMSDVERVWVAACSHVLQRRWRSVDPELLEDVAAELWSDQERRSRDPVEVAAEWLRQGIPER